MGRDGPLGWTQRSVWLDHHSVSEAGRHELNVAYRIRLAVGVGAASVRRALDATVARHEGLRTTFPLGPDGVPAQRVLPQARVEVEVTDHPTDRDAAAADREFARRTFDIEIGPVLRTRLVRVGGGSRYLLLVLHHIITDGAAKAQLLRELASRLDGGTGPVGDVLHPLDLAGRERSLDHRRSAALAYWAEVAARLPVEAFPDAHPGVAGGADAAGDLPRPVAHNAVYRSERAHDAVSVLARHYRTSPSIVFQAAIVALLSAYTGQGVVPYKLLAANHEALTAAGPPGAAFLGCLFLPVAVRVDDADRMGFPELVAAVGARCLRALGHSYVPYDEALEEITRVAARRRRPLALGPVVNCLPAGASGQSVPPGQVHWREAGWEHIDESAYVGVYRAGDAVYFELNARSANMPPADLERFLLGLEDLLAVQSGDPGRPRLAAEFGWRCGLPPQARGGPGWTSLDGARVCLANVERTLRAVPGVREARVEVTRPATGAPTVRAYVHGRPGLTPVEVRAGFLDRIASRRAMVCPDQFVVVSSGGSGDAPDWWERGEILTAGDGRSGPVAPATPYERALCDVVSQVNGVPEPDLAADYVTAGGRALRAPAVLRRLTERGLVGLSLGELLSVRPLRGLAAQLSTADGGPAPAQAPN